MSKLEWRTGSIDEVTDLWKSSCAKALRQERERQPWGLWWGPVARQASPGLVCLDSVRWIASGFLCR